MGDEAVRGFMKGNGDNYWDHPDGRQVEHILDKPRSSAADYPHLLDLRSEATRLKKSKISATKVWVSIRGENYVAVLDGKTFKERPARAASGHAIHATNLRRLFPRGPHTAGEV